MARLDAEVIVIGAGPAGAAAAIPLAEAGHDVLVLERKAAADGEDITSGEVLAPATQTECAGLGVLLAGDFLLDRFTAVRNVYPDLSWTLHPLPEGLFYVHVDRGGFNRALTDRLATAGARLVWGARVAGVEITPEAAVVRLGDGSALRARLVIDAGGRYAPSHRSLDLKDEDPEFRQIGVALFFASFAGTPLHTWDRHMHGTQGILLSGSRIRPGLYRYILEADLADKQSARLRPVDFYEATVRQHDPWLQQRIMREPRVGRVWAMAPLAFRVREVAADRLLLAGDAAGYVSPITGQGIEFAMRMGRLAAAAASQALARGSLGAAAFASYVEERRAEVETAVAYVRQQLRVLRDREGLLRAAHDADHRRRLFGPAAAETTDQGSLLDET